MSLLLWIQNIFIIFIASSECYPLGTAVEEVVPVTTIKELHHPQYAFSYVVYDPHTKDKKAHWETRDGDEVNGAYSLLDPDGAVRIVEYNANDLKGFTAVVKKLGDSAHPTEVVQNVVPITEQAVHTLPVPIPIQAPPEILLKTEAKRIETSPEPLLSNIETKQVPLDSAYKIPVPAELSYGLGAAALAIGVPKVVFERGSLPWDPATGSYGGWRPLRATSNDPYATVYSRKYINGNLHRSITGPISLIGKTLYIKKYHR